MVRCLSGHHLSFKHHLGDYNSDLLSLRSAGFFSAPHNWLSLELGKGAGGAQNILFMRLGQFLKLKAVCKGWSIEIQSLVTLCGRNGSTRRIWRVAVIWGAQLWVHALLSPSLSPSLTQSLAGLSVRLAATPLFLFLSLLAFPTLKPSWAWTPHFCKVSTLPLSLITRFEDTDSRGRQQTVKIWRQRYHYTSLEVSLIMESIPCLLVFLNVTDEFIYYIVWVVIHSKFNESCLKLLSSETLCYQFLPINNVFLKSYWRKKCKPVILSLK